MSQLTAFAGLLQLEAGESLSVNGYQFFDNEKIIDSYLNAFVTHRHDGHAAVQEFASSPTLTPDDVGGSLTSGDTWWVGITAVDEFGGETVASVASATIPGAIADPSVAPSATVFNDNTGTLTAGTYRYSYTIVSGSGESLPSPITNALVHTDGHVQITASASGMDWRLYRSFGYGPLTRIGSTMSSAGVFDDDGTATVYIDQPPPDENSTGSTGSIYVARPSVPASAAYWRVYASQEEDLPDPSLWSTDGVTIDISTSASSIVIQDPEDFIAGTPPLVNHTIPGASPILAQDVSYGGNSPYLGSGTVEQALDALSATSGVPTYFHASGATLLQGTLTLVGGSGIVLSQHNAGSAITINGTLLNGSAGVLNIVGSGATTIINTAGTIVAYTPASGAAVNHFNASGYALLTGNVQLVGSGIVSVSQSGQNIIIHASAGTGNVSGIHASGASLLLGDITFVAGSGVSLSQNDGASSITINTTGIGPASAGVNSLAVGVAPQVQGDIGLYGYSGVSISQSGSAFIFTGSASTNITVNGSAGVIDIVAGTDVTISSSAGVITINSTASGSGGSLTIPFLTMENASKLWGRHDDNLMSPQTFGNTTGRVYAFYCGGDLTVNSILIRSGTGTSNCMQMGIFDDAGNQVWTSGALSVNGGTTKITVNLPVSLTEGKYYMMVTNNGSSSSNSTFYVTPSQSVSDCGTYVVTGGAIPGSIAPSAIASASNTQQPTGIILDATA